MIEPILFSAVLVGFLLIGLFFLTQGGRFAVVKVLLPLHVANLALSQATFFGVASTLANQAVVPFTLALAISARSTAGSKPMPSWARWLILYGLVMAAFGWRASDVFVHLATWLTFSLLVYAAVHLAEVPAAIPLLRKLTYGFIGFYLVSYVTGVGASVDRLGQWFLWGANPNQFATVAVAATAMGLARGKGLVALGALVAILSGSIGALISAIAVAATLGIQKIGRLWSTLVAVSLAVFVFVSSLVVEVEAGQRREFLAVFLDRIREAPVRGALARPGEVARLIDFRGANSSAHNLYVETLYVGGVLAAFLLLMFVITVRKDPIVVGVLVLGMFTVAPANPTYLLTVFSLVSMRGAQSRVPSTLTGRPRSSNKDLQADDSTKAFETQ